MLDLVFGSMIVICGDRKKDKIVFCMPWKKKVRPFDPKNTADGAEADDSKLAEPTAADDSKKPADPAAPDTSTPAEPTGADSSKPDASKQAPP